MKTFGLLSVKQWLLATCLVAVSMMAVAVIAAQNASPASSEQAAKQGKTTLSVFDNSKYQRIVLGSGCFWGAEKRYEAMNGVVDAVSGYAGGNVSPTYDEITQRKHKNNPNNHAEVVEVTFDPSKITVTQLLKGYFENHDPTQLNRQGNDVGTQYRSVIFTTQDAQKTVAEQLKATYQTKLTAAGYGNITTQIKPLDQFYAAEAYHQDYLKKNPNGYCPDHSTGVKFDKATPQKVDNSALLVGKQIVVIDADYDCPFCKQFKQEVANGYKGSISMTYRLATQLDGLDITTPTWATPTVLFIENGKEVAGHQGYLSAKAFYEALGKFKLGDSKAYKVAFKKGTDKRYHAKYKEYKDTPSGYFVDTLSGEKLFDTNTRFDSGSGWLSFTKAVDGAVTYHDDSSFGMKRTEIRSAKTGIHLGHVFDDGPNGQPRYCINATVLDFQPRK